MSERFKSLKEYVPGEQPRDRKYIKLNTNESPFPPPQSVIDAAARETECSNLYPDPTYKDLREALASAFEVEPSNIAVANGSDEILSFAFTAFCDSATGAVFPDITYGFYEVFSALHTIPHTCIPLREDFSILPEDYKNAKGTIFIANPNAPTGLALSSDKIESILSSNRQNVVVIDEAYVDFGAESSVPLIRKYPNLIVVGTFSKSRSLAGARLGYAVASNELIKDIDKIRCSNNPYNVSRATAAAGIAALSEQRYYEENIAAIKKTRALLLEKLSSLGFFCTDSMANFVFARHPMLGGEECYRLLKENGVLVRHFSSPRTDDYVRITVGSESEINKLSETLAQILRNKNSEG